MTEKWAVRYLQGDLLIVREDDQDIDIASMTERRDWEANATLIVAAPDLLAAAEGLEWSVWNQTLVKMQCPTCFGLEPTHHDTCALDAAIKKAKGQQ